MSVKKTVLHYFPTDILDMFKGISDDFFDSIEEIRLRTEKPILIYKKGLEYTLDEKFRLTKDIEKGVSPSKEQIGKCLELMCNHSIYAYEDEIKQGFLTISGGHRVGLCGKAILDGEKMKNLKHINSLNIRLTHEIKGCASDILKFLVDSDALLHTLIISPPGCGKTTILRDLIRLISSGTEGVLKPLTVSVVDERSEICGCVLGVAQNDVGARTDVLDGCPKDVGMMMLLRSMAPRVIAVDEIGRHSDIYAIDQVINAGITLIATCHGQNITDIKKREALGQFIEKRIIKRFVVLEGRGLIKAIYDENENDIYNV